MNKNSQEPRLAVHADDPPGVFVGVAKFLAAGGDFIDQFANELLKEFSDSDAQKVAAEKWIEKTAAPISAADPTIGDAYKRLAVSRFRRRGIM